MSRFTHRCRQTLPLTSGVLFFAAMLSGVWYYLLKPWPGVEATPDATIVDAPPNNEFRAGDVLTWTKERICVPEGTTTVTFFIRRSTEDLQLDSVAYTRYITTDGYCGDNAATAIVIPDWLRNGPTQLILRACTDTPNPRDTCIETPGPSFIMTGASF